MGDSCRVCTGHHATSWPGIDAGFLTMQSWGEGYMYNVILIGCLNNWNVMRSCWGDQAP